MKGRHISIVCLVLLLFFPFVALAQSDITYQYWIDDNKDNATSETVTDSGSGGGISLNLDVGSLSPGVHFYTIRFYEDPLPGSLGDPQWSAPQRYIFSIPAVAANSTPADLQNMEYWIDNDYEHRTLTTISGDEYTSGATLIDVSTLTPGVHFYNVRVRDQDGIWGATQRYIFSIPAVAVGSTPADLQNVEYWIDNDYEHRTLTTISGDANNLDNIEMDLTGYTPGVHFYNVRVQDEDGIWGAPQRIIFSIPAVTSGETPKNLKQYEYWIDDDYANKKTRAAADDEYPDVFTISVSSLSPGVHYLNLRVKDLDDIWGAPQRTLFSIPAPQPTAVEKLITGYSYAFNDDAYTSVTFDTPVEEYNLELSLDAPDPKPLMVVDDDCTLSFDADQNKATLSRDVHMQFAVFFKDQSNTMSAPTVEQFDVNDTQTEDITAITSPGTYAVPSHADGGFSVFRIVVESATSLMLKTNGECGFRLYNADGEWLYTYDATNLQGDDGVSRTFEVGTYYAIAFGNSDARKFGLAPSDKNSLKPTILFDQSSNLVTITPPFPDAHCYYTTDGTDPTVNSQEYTAPFTVSSDQTIMAIAVWGDMVVSEHRTKIISGLLGDANGNGIINIEDVVAIINYILGKEVSGTFDDTLADMNSDDVVDIFDAMLLVNYVLAHPSASSGSRKMSRGDADEPTESLMLAAEQDGISLGVDRAERFTAFQFDISLPKGTELSDVRLVSESSAHRLMFTHNGGNTYRVVGFSMSNSLFPAADDKFIDIKLANATNGDIYVYDVLFVSPDMKKVNFASRGIGTTAIEGIDSDSEANDSEEIYNLQGQKIANSRKKLDKGVYIINKKKVIIK
ncbi:chitobiase/beta-hexosaminidase C-terminal domain-containing protein [Xylanibacter ruminicola]|uniref:Chitobiase/beta-hexosaminidase C-terminal domain-containing protein n=1 Tax=Xylanibacter ruminicola TaxID=839 RepID=A0A1M6YZW4_XYLRU|nr:chitobiase/beta-hexosaminidase C-terminal domain-containing protein [Xylanibacter ruminicola]SHL23655.1 Chitobiase/beta-hexosaminidase C-terminal domain-containing protein [Xylanibacter ruminicola]